MRRRTPAALTTALAEARGLRDRLAALERGLAAAQEAFFSAANFRALVRGLLWGVAIGILGELLLVAVVLPLLTRGDTLGPGGY